MSHKKFLLAVTILGILIAVIILALAGGRGQSLADDSSSRRATLGLDENSAEVKVALPAFHRVSENYLRGATPRRGSIEVLKRLGVRALVDLRSIYDHTDDIGLAVEREGLRYFWLPTSVWNPPTDEETARFLSVVSDEATGPFYVFCADGLNRTGEMTAIYRIAHDQVMVEQALKEIDDAGFNPYYYTLRNYVWDYARKFYPRAMPQPARRAETSAR